MECCSGALHCHFCYFSSDQPSSCLLQTTRNAKSSLLSLGEDACTLVYTVWTTCDEVLQRQRGATQTELEAEPREKGGEQDDNLVDGRLDEPIDLDMDAGEHGETQDEEGKEAEAEGEEKVEKLDPHLEVNLKKLCS